MMTKNLKKLIGGVIALGGAICLFVGNYMLKKLDAAKLEEIRKENMSFSDQAVKEPLIWGGVLILACAILLFIAWRVVYSREHKSSAIKGLIFAMALPLESVLFMAYRIYSYVFSGIDSKTLRTNFFRNSTILWNVVIIITVAIGILTVIFSRQREYGAPLATPSDLKVKSGLLGAMNAMGYAICDVILTSDENGKIAIMIFEDQEAMDYALGRGYFEEIRSAVAGMEPDYRVEFEAQS